jgi:tRNA-specific 2-thiouridylase
VLCNAEIKFKAFLDHAMTLGADHIATGHYARVRSVESAAGPRFELLKALDHTKDQSYFLHRLNQAQLSRTLFPLGEIPKSEVRRIAHELKLSNAAKKDSTGICFIGERPFREFLNRYLPTKPGPILTESGKQVGKHHGLSFYTLGQRKGLGIGGVKGHQHADGTGPVWYAARKDLENNALYVVEGHDHPWLLSDALSADQASWVAGVAPEAGPYAAKTRYRQADAPCALSGASSEVFDLSFSDPQWAVTPGQSAVLYDGDICLGGGIIAS